jgi:tetratricopeptide (TPR) repeat protein
MQRSPEFSSNIVVDNVTYHVQTEDLGKKTCRIATRIYHKGEIVFSRDSDYSHLLKLKGFDEKLQTMMENQHKSSTDFFVREQAAKQKQKSQYFEEVQGLLKKGEGKSAITILEEALRKFPGDPFLLSYYGCLVAVVRENPREGISICLDAIKRLDETIPFGSEFFYPVFYLNLGRAYLKAGKKQETINAFYRGLKNDPDNREIHQELVKLGNRRKLPVPFLKRSNPINKYIGLLTSKK